MGIIRDNARDEEIEVQHFVRNGEWDKELLLSQLSEKMVDLIIRNIKALRNGNSNDLP